MFRRLLEGKKLFWLRAAFIVFAVVLLIKLILVMNQREVYQGISVEGINIGNMTPSDAEKLLNSSSDNLLRNIEMRLRYDDSIIVLKPETIDLKPDMEDAIREAYNTGRKGNLFTRIFQVLQTSYQHNQIHLRFTYNLPKVLKLLDDINRRTTIFTKNASIKQENGKLKITPEEYGRYLDVDQCVAVIDRNIQNKSFGDIDLVFKQTKPEILAEDLAGVSGEIGSSSTIFSLGDNNRVENIRLASNRINGTVILPGRVFSMNDVLGPRTVQNGYKEAKVIFKNELVPGLGGGVCQVTTTLYRTVLYSLLEVVERTNHSLTLSYVEPGQDATLAEGYIDFKFRNNTGLPIVVFSSIDKNKLSVKIYGGAADKRPRIRLISEISEVIPPGEAEIIVDSTLKPNEKVVSREAQNGLKVKVYREVYLDNKLLQRELVSEDKYQPVKGQLKVGAPNSGLKELIIGGSGEGSQ